MPNKAIASSSGLTLLTGNDSIVSRITNSYSSPNQVGNIKGAWLADSVAGAVGAEDPDRSVNAKNLVLNGALTKTAVAPSAELMGYSGWGVSNYLESLNVDFPTDSSLPFHFLFWLKVTTPPRNAGVVSYGVLQDGQLRDVLIDSGGLVAINPRTQAGFKSNGRVDSDTWRQVCITFKNDVVTIFIDGNLDKSGAFTNFKDITAGAIFRVGESQAGFTPLPASNYSLVRAGAGAPTAHQAKEIYDAELPLFQPNAKCLLQGGSSDVKSLDFDSSTGLLTVCSATHTTVFDGLRVASDEAVISTSISTVSGKVARGV